MFLGIEMMLGNFFFFPALTLIPGKLLLYQHYENSGAIELFLEVY